MACKCKEWAGPTKGPALKPPREDLHVLSTRRVSMYGSGFHEQKPFRSMHRGRHGLDRRINGLNRTDGRVAERLLSQREH